MPLTAFWDAFSSTDVANVNLTGRVTVEGRTWNALANTLSVIYRDNLTDDAPKGIRSLAGGAPAPVRGNRITALDWSNYGRLIAEGRYSRVTPAGAAGFIGLGFTTRLDGNAFDWGIYYGIGRHTGAAQYVTALLLRSPLTGDLATFMGATAQAEAAPFTNHLRLEVLRDPNANNGNGVYTVNTYIEGVQQYSIASSDLVGGHWVGTVGGPLRHPAVVAGDYMAAGVGVGLDYCIDCNYYAENPFSSQGGSLSWQPYDSGVPGRLTDYQFSADLNFGTAQSYSYPLETTLDGSKRIRARTIVLSTALAGADVLINLNGLLTRVPASQELTVPAPDTPAIVITGSSGVVNLKMLTLPYSMYQRTAS